MAIIVLCFVIFHQNYRQRSMSFIQNNLYQVTDMIGSLRFKKIFIMKDPIWYCYQMLSLKKSTTKHLRK